MCRVRAALSARNSALSSIVGSAIACARGRDRIGRHASDVHLLLHGDVAGDAIFRCGKIRVEDPAESPALVVVGRLAEDLLAQRRPLAGRRLGAGDRVGAGSAVVTCRTSHRPSRSRLQPTRIRIDLERSIEYHEVRSLSGRGPVAPTPGRCETVLS